MNRRFFFAAAIGLVVAACTDAIPTEQFEAPRALLSPAGAHVDPALTQQLAGGGAVVAIVTIDDAASTALVTQAVMGTGAGVIGFKHLPMLLAHITPAQATAIASLPGVRGLYADGREELMLREAVQSVRADVVHASGVTGAGVGIAIMDSGVNGLHPDLEFPGKTVANVKFTVDPRDLFTVDGTPRAGMSLFVEDLANTDNTSGHGTHVAGIAAGSGAGSSAGIYRGVAPGAHVVGLGVGDGLHIINSSVLMATDWLLEHGAEHNVRVVNNSWGSSGEFDPNDPISIATRKLYEAGITVVFAAGNEGPGPNTMNRRSVAPWVISVAAGCKIGVVDPTNSASQCQDANGRAPVLAGFSSRGIPGDAMYRPDITAPGVRIVAARSYTGTVMNALDATADANVCNIAIQHVDDYTCASGTSMASPVIAGVVALMVEASQGRITPDGALDALTRTARPLTGYAAWEVGAGFVDAEAAVRRAARIRK
jgi:serine protease AprX